MSDWKKVEQAKTWIFTDKPEMVGVYTGKEENIGENNSTVYNFETADGENVSVWGSTVLDTRLKNVKEGQEVKIKFLGEVPSPNRKGKTYKNFEVYHRDVETEFNKLADEVLGE